MNDQTIFDFIRDSNKQLSDIREDIGELKAHAEQQVSHEKRLTRAESDLRNIRRIFTGLFTLIVAAGTGAVTWLKNLQ